MPQHRLMPRSVKSAMRISAGGCIAALAVSAVTIQATADEVWPWIAQLGPGRGGFYSYDWLENVAGADIHSADTVVDRWQQVAVGDVVNLARRRPGTQKTRPWWCHDPGGRDRRRGRCAPRCQPAQRPTVKICGHGQEH